MIPSPPQASIRRGPEPADRNNNKVFQCRSGIKTFPRPAIEEREEREGSFPELPDSRLTLLILRCDRDGLPFSLIIIHTGEITVYQSVLLLLLFASNSFAFDDPRNAESAFDFWVGRWNVHWFTAESVRVEGTNVIEATLDGKVLQEHFEDPSNNFRGTSISVFRVADSTWRQAWADNQGGYFDFVGEIDGQTRVFRTHASPAGADSAYQRMRFYDILPGSFTWDWEGTRDGGRTWKLLWRIYYLRMPEAPKK